MAQSLSSKECREVLARVSEYLDQELPPDVCERIQAHLEGCAPCESLAEEMKRSLAAIREYRDGEAPGPLAAEVRDRLLAAYRRAIGAGKPAL
jgi:anti-sigma factor (TIGR02949 family)